MFGILFVTVLCLIYGYWLTVTKRPKNFPPGPKWYPFLGSAPILRKEIKKLGSQHKVFEKWMDDYKSPLIGLKLGNEYVVVALTYPIVSAVHTNELYDGRPDNFFIRLRTMGSRLGITGADGPTWMENRNFTLRHLKQAGYGRQPMEVQIQNELNEILDIFGQQKDQAFWPGNHLSFSVINVLWRFAAGQKISRNDDRLQRLLTLMRQRSKAFDMSGGTLNQMPWLRHIAPEKSGFNLINRFNAELKNFLMETINEHKNDYDDDKQTDDLIYAYIKEMKEHENEPDSNYTDAQLTFSILDIFIAGSETTSITLDLALMTMAMHPEIQTRVQSELDQVLTHNQLPMSNDRTKCPYTDAVIMEVQRFYHILPVTGPRRNFEATQLGGYDLPKNTTILIGLRTVLMDKNYWGDPNVFRPERFLDDDMKVVNTDHLMPFGQGKRRCLGEALARACLFTYFAGILQNFTITIPKGEKMPDINLQPGIILSPKPYNVTFSRRFHIL